jgi:hypothetical protein
VGLTSQPSGQVQAPWYVGRTPIRPKEKSQPPSQHVCLIFTDQVQMPPGSPRRKTLWTKLWFFRFTRVIEGFCSVCQHFQKELNTQTMKVSGNTHLGTSCLPCSVFQNQGFRVMDTMMCVGHYVAQPFPERGRRKSQSPCPGHFRPCVAFISGRTGHWASRAIPVSYP